MTGFMRYAVIAATTLTLSLSALAQEKPAAEKKAAKKATDAVEKKVETVDTKKSAAKKKAETAVEEKKAETEKKAPAAAKTAEKKTAEKKAVAKAGAPYTGGVINLNTATKSQLEALPGVGEANANHIIKGRPYKSADELITRKIIQERYYNEFKAHVTTK